MKASTMYHFYTRGVLDSLFFLISVVYFVRVNTTNVGTESPIHQTTRQKQQTATSSQQQTRHTDEEEPDPSGDVYIVQIAAWVLGAVVVVVVILAVICMTIRYVRLKKESDQPRDDNVDDNLPKDRSSKINSYRNPAVFTSRSPQNESPSSMYVNTRRPNIVTSQLSKGVNVYRDPTVITSRLAAIGSPCSVFYENTAQIDYDNMPPDLRRYVNTDYGRSETTPSPSIGASSSSSELYVNAAIPDYENVFPGEQTQIYMNFRS